MTVSAPPVKQSGPARLGLVMAAVRQKERWNLYDLLFRAWGLLNHPADHRKVCSVLALPKFRGLVERHPRSPYKYLADRYLATGLSTRARAGALVHHYGFVHEHLREAFIRAVLFDRVLLWRHADEEHECSIALRFPRTVHIEGELSLCFEWHGRDVFTMSFTIVPGWVVQLSAERVLLVGQVQGARGGLQAYRAAMKVMRRLRPESALLAAMQGFAGAFDIPLLAGVCARNQVSNRAGEDALFATAYDAFWESFGARRSQAGFFVLPFPLPEKPIHEVNPRRRAVSRRRRAHRRWIHDTVLQTLQGTAMEADAPFCRRGL